MTVKTAEVVKIPVIIAARDEERYIGQALDGLDAERVEPLVVANGCKDRTAEIARSFGAKVLELGEPGKLAAVQQGLKELGAAALNPVLFMDADSRPLFPKLWANSMVRSLSADRPSVASGVTGLVDGRKIDNGLRMLRRYQKSVAHRLYSGNDSLFGYNMATRIGSEEKLDEVLAMEDIWPGEDRAMGDVITGEVGGYRQSLDLRSCVLTSARRHLPLKDRIKLGAKKSEQVALGHYAALAADTGVVASYHQGVYYPAANYQLAPTE